MNPTCFSYNKSRQETTRHTPFFLMYGQDARLPIHVALEQDANGDQSADKILARVRRHRIEVRRMI